MNVVKVFLLASVLLLFCPLVQAIQSGNAIGSLPAVVGSSTTAATVKPGESATNTDGVTVKNDSASKGNAKIDPKVGTVDSATSVVTKNGFHGSIDGLDSNDTSDIGANNIVDITAAGGTVNIAGGSTVKVTNNSNGNDNITVNLPSGGSASIPPGSSSTFST